jgi:translation initiation factor IF-2
MSRIRVLDLAKELNLETKVALGKLSEIGVAVKNHFSAISDIEADKLRSYLRKGRIPEKDKSTPQSRVVIRRRVVDADAEASMEAGNTLGALEKSGGSVEFSAATPEAVQDITLNHLDARTSPKAGPSEEPLSETMAQAPSAQVTSQLPVPEKVPSVATADAPLKASEKSAPKKEPKSAVNEAPEPSLSANKVAQGSPSVWEGDSSPVLSEKNKSVTLPGVSISQEVALDGLTANQSPAQSAVSESVVKAGSAVTPSPEAPSTTGATIVSRPAPGATAPTARPAGTGAVIIKQAPPPSSSQGGTASDSSAPGSRAVIIKRGETPSVSASGMSSSGGQGNQSRIIANRPTGGGFPTNRTVAESQRSSSSTNAYHSSTPFGGGPRKEGGGIQMRTAREGGGFPNPRPAGGGFPSARDGGGGIGGPRPAGPGGAGGRFGGPGGAPRPGGPAGGGIGGGFGTPEAGAVAGKEPGTRRDREKEALKRKQNEEIETKVKARAKGRQSEDELLDEELLDELLLEGDAEEAVVAPTVRTMIPNRKKGSFKPIKKDKRSDALANPTKASKKVLKVDNTISVADLAGLLSIKSSLVIKSLMKLGLMATVNQMLDIETSTLVAQEFGFEVQDSTVSIDDILSKKKTDVHESGEHTFRSPVVTIMGHVDHGKTSLLDAIRSTNVADKEAGGITQHIGAYQVSHNDQKITFLDTPGHEAFTSMRARGAQVTDIVVLVVAADDGVMPQTIEAINHARAAKVPVIVAVNKMDKSGASLEKIQRELSQHNVVPEDWGGDCIFVPVSAKTRAGIDSLLESILLQAEVLELKASEEGLAQGVVIEARLDKSRGPVASVIVTQGTLKVSDVIVVGTSYGRVRAMFNDKGERVTVAGPSMPIEIIGIGEVPSSGDMFNCVVNEAIAKEAVGFRIEKQKLKESSTSVKASLADLLAKMQDGSAAMDFPIILKADTHGSVEAIKNAVSKLQSTKIKSKFIHSGVGAITETDVTLAEASNALILGFNVRPDRAAAELAEREKVDLRVFSIIYEIVDSIQAIMVGRLAPVRSEKIQGHAEVRSVFSVPKIGNIAGCAVTDGIFTRNSHIRVLRDSIVIYTGRVGSLKRFKDDVKEVRDGFECGIGVENYNDIKPGDVLESFIIEETADTL